jgi:hypothetical protein
MSKITNLLPKVSLPNVVEKLVHADPVQNVTDCLSTDAFEKFRPGGDPAKLEGANRVAYGPLQAAPTLKRPVVMVPGFTMEARSFDRMAQQLASNPANGPVAVYDAKSGTFHKGAVDGPLMTAAQVKAAKIFEVQYADPFTGPSVKAPQLAKAFDAVKRMTGAADVDAVTHSEGGTDLRLYLDSRAPGSGPQIAHAVMIGPASHGTEVGNLGAVFGGVVKHANVAAGELAVGSPLNQRLLANWDAIRSQAKDGFTIIGVTGAPTLQKDGGLIPVHLVDGDGFMPAADLGLPGAKTVTMKGPHHTAAAHLWEVQYSGVINQAMGVLGQ